MCTCCAHVEMRLALKCNREQFAEYFVIVSVTPSPSPFTSYPSSELMARIPHEQTHRHICAHTHTCFNSIRMTCVCVRGRVSACVKDNEIKSRPSAKKGVRIAVIVFARRCDTRIKHNCFYSLRDSGVSLTRAGVGSADVRQTPRHLFAYSFSVNRLGKDMSCVFA